MVQPFTSQQYGLRILKVCVDQSIHSGELLFPRVARLLMLRVPEIRIECRIHHSARETVVPCRSAEAVVREA